MTKYGMVGTAPRIVVLILALIVLVFSGFIWFDFLGLIDVKDTFAPVLGWVGIRPRTKIEFPQAPDLLDQQRLAQQWEALDLREEALVKAEDALDLREAELVQMMEKVQEQQKVVEEKEKSFNARTKQYENRNANLREASLLFVSMPPAEAVARLVEMEDQDIIDILRMTDDVAEAAGENSVSSYWLQLMPAERSARIQEKMIDKPS